MLVSPVIDTRPHRRVDAHLVLAPAQGKSAGRTVGDPPKFGSKTKKAY
jgi:hypothetical protein